MEFVLCCLGGSFFVLTPICKPTSTSKPALPTNHPFFRMGDDALTLVAWALTLITILEWPYNRRLCPWTRSNSCTARIFNHRIVINLSVSLEVYCTLSTLQVALLNSLHDFYSLTFIFLLPLFISLTHTIKGEVKGLFTLWPKYREAVDFHQCNCKKSTVRLFNPSH
jgi:hypothetical protein